MTYGGASGFYSSRGFSVEDRHLRFYEDLVFSDLFAILNVAPFPEFREHSLAGSP